MPTYASGVAGVGFDPCRHLTPDAGLVRQFGIGAVVIGEASNFCGGHAWLQAEVGTEVLVLDDEPCKRLLATFIKEQPAVWNEDIGVVKDE